MNKPETILRSKNMTIPYDVICSAIPIGEKNAIGIRSLKTNLKDYDVSNLTETIEICMRYGAPIDKKNGKYFRVSNAKEYADKILREKLNRQLGIKNQIEYR